MQAPPAEPILLAIEDDPAHAALLGHILVPAPDWVPHLVVRPDLQSGLERLATGGLDLVLLDLNLGDSRGLETLERVRHAAPGLPVVVMSSLEDETTALIAVQQGAQDYIVKGTVDEQGLRRVVRYALERQRLHTALAETQEKLRLLSGLLPVCAWCGRMRDDEGCWHTPEEYVRRRTSMELTHGICPSCRAEVVEAVPPADVPGAPGEAETRASAARNAGRKGQP